MNSIHVTVAGLHMLIGTTVISRFLMNTPGSEFGPSFLLLRHSGVVNTHCAGGIRVSEWVAPFVFSTKWNQLRRSTKSKAGERGSNERTTEEEETAAAMNELLFGIGGGGSDKSKVSRWASEPESRLLRGFGFLNI